MWDKQYEINRCYWENWYKTHDIKTLVYSKSIFPHSFPLAVTIFSYVFSISKAFIISSTFLRRYGFEWVIICILMPVLTTSSAFYYQILKFAKVSIHWKAMIYFECPGDLGVLTLHNNFIFCFQTFLR